MTQRQRRRSTEPQRGVPFLAALWPCSFCLVWLMGCGIFSGPTALEVLAAELEGIRWSELRIEGLAHSPSHGLPRPDYDPPVGILINTYKALGSGEKTGGPATALLYMARAVEGDSWRALSTLDGEPENPRRWNLEAAIHFNDGDWPQALEKLERAMEVDPTDEVTLFNRAVVLSSLPLPHAPKEAWDAFLQVAAPSPWRDEAEDRRAVLELPRPRLPDLGEDRRKLKEALLLAGSAADLRALVEEEQNAALLQGLAEMGDTFLANGIRYREGLSPAEWRALARAGANLDDALNRAVAGEEVVGVLERLVGLSDPLVSVGAMRGLAYIHIVRSDAPRARHWLHRIIAACGPHGCWEEAALAASDLGTVEAERGDYLAAERALEGALDGMPEGFAFRRAELLNKQSFLAHHLGAPEAALQFAVSAAWVHLQRERMDGLAGSLRNVGAALRRRQLPHAAMAVSTETIEVAKLSGVLRLQIGALFGHALDRSALGDRGLALRDLELAAQLASKASLRRQVSGVHLSLAWEAIADGLFSKSLHHATETFESAMLMQNIRLQAEALHALGASHLGAGMEESALESLYASTVLFESALQGTALPDRLQLEKKSGIVHGLLAKTLSSRGEHGAAWRLMGAGEPRALTPGECRVAIGALGEHSFSMWIQSASGSTFEGLEDLSPGEVGSLYSSARCGAETRRLTVIENRTTLKGIVGPWSRRERPEVEVVIARSVAQPWPSEAITGTALIVHSPKVGVRHARLPRLWGAVEEVRLALAFLPGSMELSGEDATPAAVERASLGHRLLHFAVHGESAGGAPEASYLVLGGEGGLLQVVDVLDLQLDSDMPVVLLSACKVGGVDGDGRGTIGLPWAFLEAGASAVIATSERLDDRAAVDFSRAFYEAVGQGSSAQAAFERGIEVLREKWPPEVAAAYSFWI